MAEDQGLQSMLAGIMENERRIDEIRRKIAQMLKIAIARQTDESNSASLKRRYAALDRQLISERYNDIDSLLRQDRALMTVAILQATSPRYAKQTEAFAKQLLDYYSNDSNAKG